MSKLTATVVPAQRSERAFVPRAKLETRRVARRELVSLTLGLAIVLVAIKALLLPWEVHSTADFIRWTLRLGVVSAADVLFVAGFMLVCGSASWMALRFPRGYACWRPLMYLLFYAAGVYAIAAMALFRVTLQPFNIRMLTLVEGPAVMFDSIDRYLTWQWLTALAVAPLALLLTPLAARRVAWLRNGAPLGWKGTLAMAALVGGYAAAGQAYVSRNWTEPNRWERRIACNPHLAFLGSCVEEFLKDEPFLLDFNPDSYDTSDFTVRERPDRRPALNLPNFPATGRRPKNVVLVNLESVGAEYCGLYGSKHNTTPQLERLVKERGGVVFDNYYVAVPYSCKSMIALSHSVYPRLDWKLIVTDCLDFDVPMVSEVLQDNGYRVCYAHSGYWSWRGRDRYLKTRVGTLLDAEQLPGQKTSSWGVDDRAMYEAALDWVDAEPGKPFFLYAFTIETHHPYATPHAPVDFGVEDEDLQDYLSSIRAADENIAWLFEQLDKRKLLEDTLVIVTSDNGEAFGQHNQRSHNFGIYECNVHLPLVLFHPSLKSYPRRIEAPREQIDIAPTMLDALNIPSPAVWQGRNLFRQGDDRPAYFFCVGNDVQIGLRHGKWKYHYYVGSDEEELFDVAADPGEKHNLAQDHPDLCAGYRKRVAGLAKYQRPFLRAHGAD